MPRTIWLASYPKSGNTWFRIFLASLLYPKRRPLDLNDLPLQTPIASSRIHFDETLGVPSALLTPAEAARLRPMADRLLNDLWEGSRLVRKAHDAYTWLPDGRPLMGRAPNFAAIYLLRDPWDVAVSAAHHFSCKLDEAVRHLNNPHFTVARNRRGLESQLPQRLLSWEGHALSWLSAPMPVHLMRFEAMKQDPLSTFRAAVRFLGFEHDDCAIEEALEACRFERLQQREREQRFREAPAKATGFFRSGAVGEGRARLSPAQLEGLMRMKRRVDRAIGERFG
ncbi:sulfotransferase family protein [Thioflavicoccus mobilis 8321]|uniref:Sulfotransferase family protein n=1 Tax=Thioflavicoccus mobilis 8321 TaxID=765912 RepID=L0H2G7_9GAMM|nr:sulfotransferase domain-containing protein [Thioflavicoccus mobilis]AGA92247.1 sulfotransferase family protein [Thioflavicoccus mobilis 8321]